MKRNLINYAKTYEEPVIDLTNRMMDAGLADKVRLMPDTHYGKGSAIGFTAPMTEKINPDVIGVDIGCGMTIWKLPKDINLEEFDKIVHNKVPAGFDPKTNTDKHDERNAVMRFDDFTETFVSKLTPFLKDKLKDDGKWFLRQLGSLGSGNHFVEINVDKEDNKYLVIHSGSRGLGVFVNKHWKNLANEWVLGNKIANKQTEVREELRDKVAEEKLEQIVLHKTKSMKLSPEEKEVTYLIDSEANGYLSDMKVAQTYALENRRQMAKLIFDELGLEVDNQFWFDSTHNFIAEDNIIRKGATSAYEGQMILVPLNMSAGTIIGKGKGNEEWNFSAPHGAGRLMSRRRAKEEISMKDYVDSMKDVFSTTVVESTLDEAPLAYKAPSEIIELVEPTMEVIEVIKPIYNFKGIS